MEYYSASGLRTCVFSVTKHKRPVYKYKNSLFLSFTFLNWAAVGKLKEFVILPCVSTKWVHGLLELGEGPYISNNVCRSIFQKEMDGDKAR